MPETSSDGLVALPEIAADSGRLPARRVLPRPDRREIAAIFAGGAAGTLACAVLSKAFQHPATAWPWPTFTVNVVARMYL